VDSRVRVRSRTVLFGGRCGVTVFRNGVPVHVPRVLVAGRVVRVEARCGNGDGGVAGGGVRCEIEIRVGSILQRVLKRGFTADVVPGAAWCGDESSNFVPEYLGGDWLVESESGRGADAVDDGEEAFVVDAQRFIFERVVSAELPLTFRVFGPGRSVVRG